MKNNNDFYALTYFHLIFSISLAHERKGNNSIFLGGYINKNYDLSEIILPSYIKLKYSRYFLIKELIQSIMFLIFDQFSMVTNEEKIKINNVFLFNDGTYLGYFLRLFRFQYYLIEDSHGKYSHKNHQIDFDSIYKRKLDFRKCHGSYSKTLINYTFSMEGVQFLKKNGIDNFQHIDSFELLTNLPGYTVNSLNKVLIGEEAYNYFINNPNLILTGTRIDLNHKILAKFITAIGKGSETFLIKPHPKDYSDYEAISTKFIQIKSDFPVQMIFLDSKIRLNKLVSIGTRTHESIPFYNELFVFDSVSDVN